MGLDKVLAFFAPRPVANADEEVSAEHQSAPECTGHIDVSQYMTEDEDSDAESNSRSVSSLAQSVRSASPVASVPGNPVSELAAAATPAPANAVQADLEAVALALAQLPQRQRQPSASSEVPSTTSSSKRKRKGSRKEDESMRKMVTNLILHA